MPSKSPVNGLFVSVSWRALPGTLAGAAAGAAAAGACAFAVAMPSISTATCERPRMCRRMPTYQWKPTPSIGPDRFTVSMNWPDFIR